MEVTAHMDPYLTLISGCLIAHLGGGKNALLLYISKKRQLQVSPSDNHFTA
jgi:hypothetical protein